MNQQTLPCAHDGQWDIGQRAQYGELAIVCVDCGEQIPIVQAVEQWNAMRDRIEFLAEIHAGADA